MNKLFVESVLLALEMMGTNDYSAEILEKMEKINTYDDIKDIKEGDFLFEWRPALVFEKCGYEKYRNCDLNKESKQTYIIFRPGIEIDKLILENIRKENKCFIEEFRYIFTKRLIARIYGGFPWFRSYCRICDELELWNKESIAYRITSEQYCINYIVELKNKYRTTYKDKTIKRDYSDEYYPGIIHTFHTPNCIENEIHCKAIEKELIINER